MNQNQKLSFNPYFNKIESDLMAENTQTRNYRSKRHTAGPNKTSDFLMRENSKEKSNNRKIFDEDVDNVFLYPKKKRNFFPNNDLMHHISPGPKLDRRAHINQNQHFNPRLSLRTDYRSQSINGHYHNMFHKNNNHVPPKLGNRKKYSKNRISNNFSNNVLESNQELATSLIGPNNHYNNGFHNNNPQNLNASWDYNQLPNYSLKKSLPKNQNTFDNDFNQNLSKSSNLQLNSAYNMDYERSHQNRENKFNPLSKVLNFSHKKNNQSALHNNLRRTDNSNFAYNNPQNDYGNYYR